MDFPTMDQVREAMPAWLTNRYVAAAIITFAAIIAAGIVDFVVVRVCRVVARRTRTMIDDNLIDMLHGPVRTTVVLGGLWLATAQLALPTKAETFTGAIIKTLGLLVWMAFGFRVVTLLISSLTRSDRVGIIQTRTGPLFDNLAKVVIIGVAIYFVFVFWGINVSAWLASSISRNSSPA